MKVLMRIVAVLFVAIAAVLIYAVIAAATSDGGAKAGVAIAYIVGSALLIWAAVKLWRRGPAVPATTQP
jgi:threonine/homoserine/homoserine lactone efflux protein